MLGSIRSTLGTLRPFYASDGTHTRSPYNLILLAVGIDTEDRVLLVITLGPRLIWTRSLEKFKPNMLHEFLLQFCQRGALH